MYGRMLNGRSGRSLLGHAHLLQPHVLPDAHPRRRRPHAPDHNLTQYEFLKPIQHINVLITVGALCLGASRWSSW
jgi:hypothetical protein